MYNLNLNILLYNGYYPICKKFLDQKQKENITYGIRKLAHLFRAIQAVDNGAAAGGIRVIDSQSGYGVSTLWGHNLLDF